ncbi:MAG TPA: gephyrin-like molybdotransferase Glp [Acidimicrobiales bacterium]|nr:gephyrin-like molybdotransferase Glp [Acidimicrobiales bacterium]
MSGAPLAPLERVRHEILSACPRLVPTELPLADALGCVTVDEVVAVHDVPPFANTAMDGYAVRAVDTACAPVELRVIGLVAAGAAAQCAVGAGEAARIMTGAPIPAGADAVVMVERTRPSADASTVTIETTALPGDHVRRAGDDLAAGQVVMEAGTTLRPAHLGLLASVGVSDVRVSPRARVGVLSTGDELVSGAAALGPGQIRDANRPVLLALLAESGCHGVDLGMAPDKEAIIARVVDQALGDCDALLVTGGVSVGDFDYVKSVIDKLEKSWWWQVAVRPAKPLAVGVRSGKPVFGLPGNPVSSMVSFELFARPALRRMMGHSDVLRPEVEAIADEAFARRPDGKLHLIRVVATWGDDGRLHVRSAGGQASHILSAMAAANALALVPDGPGIDVGGRVKVMLLNP